MTNDQILDVLKEAKDALSEGFPMTAEMLIERLIDRISADEERFIERRGMPIDE